VRDSISTSSSSAGPARRRGLRRIAFAAILALAIPQAALADPMLAGFGTVSHADIDGSESLPRAYSIIEPGVGVVMAWRLGGWLDVGLEPRYDTGADSSPYGDRRVHFVAAPVTVTAVLQTASRRELQLGIGLGPALAILSGSGDGGSVLWLRGASAELRLGYAQPIGRTGLTGLVQAGLRFDLFWDGDQKLFTDPDLINVQYPFLRVGVRWP
jgi:hypothetical protein